MKKLVFLFILGIYSSFCWAISEKINNYSGKYSEWGGGYSDWGGYGDFRNTVSPPENMEIEYYTNGKRYIKVGQINDTVYIGGLIANYYEDDVHAPDDEKISWIYGTVCDSVITFTHKTVGDYWNINDPSGNTFWPLYIHALNKPFSSDVTLTIDSASRKIWNLNESFEISPDIWRACWWDDGVMDKIKSVNLEKFPDTPQTPKAPLMTKGELKGTAGCFIEPDLFSIDNHLLPASGLYYKIYADGKQFGENELIVFRQGDNIHTASWSWEFCHYDYLLSVQDPILGVERCVIAIFNDDEFTPPITSKVFIPFSFNSTIGTYFDDDEQYYYDSLCEDYSTLYATLVLINPDGTETESEPAYLQEAGARDVVKENEVKKEDAVYDLTGRRVSRDNLAPGLYISNGRKFIVK